MSAELKRIIVITMGDIESKGYDEQTLPLLLKIIDSSSPDNRVFTNNGVIAYYLSSPHALASIENVVVQAEKLRNNDSRFAALGIGLSEGELIAEIDLRGRLKTDGSILLGAVLANAIHVERQPQKYREILQKLRDLIH